MEKQTASEVVGVLGSGEYGMAIARRIAQSGYTVLIGSRHPYDFPIQYRMAIHPRSQIVSQSEAATAPVVVIAIGFDHYRTLPLHLLHRKIVVDVSNPDFLHEESKPSNAERLQSLIQTAYVVKAFNVISAQALGNYEVPSDRQVPIASNWPAARRKVSELAQKMGYLAIDHGILRHARLIENMPLQLLTPWQVPSLVVIALWIIHYLVLVVKYMVCGGSAPGESSGSYKEQIILNFNRSAAIAGLWSLAMCFLPGVISSYIMLARGSKFSRMPRWLNKWLEMKKQLGLLGLAMESFHTFLSLALWSGRYDPLIWQSPTIISAQTYNGSTLVTANVTVNNAAMTTQGEFFYVFGTLSLFALCLHGLASLPSVSAVLTRRETSFFNSSLGWLALILAVIHDYLLGWGFPQNHYRLCSFVPGAQFYFNLPFLTIILKLPLYLPCFEIALGRIRKGHERDFSIGPTTFCPAWNEQPKVKKVIAFA